MLMHFLEKYSLVVNMQMDCLQSCARLFVDEEFVCLYGSPVCQRSQQISFAHFLCR